MTDYGTPRRVEYDSWEGGYYTSHTSEREYVPVDHVQGSVQTPYEEYYSSETRHVQLTLYLDPETGLVLYDVEAYEKNLKETDRLIALAAEEREA